MTRFCRTVGVAVLALPAMLLAGEGLPSYYDRYRFLLTPASAWGDGLTGFSQPAMLGFLRHPEARFHWSSEAGRAFGLTDWGIYTGLPHLGFAVQTQDQGGISSTDYALGLGFGDEAFTMGLQYGFGGGDSPRDKMLALGSVWRPAPFASISACGRFSLESNDYEWSGELGIRPLGTPRLTLFGDMAWRAQVTAKDVPWSGGATFQVTPGVDLVGRYFDGGAFTVGLSLNLGRSGAATQSHLDDQGDFSGQSYGLRLGALKSGLATGPLAKGKRYVPMYARGRVQYLKYRHFDLGGTRLYDLERDIRTARLDPRVSAVALNISGMEVWPEHAWEIRTALEELKAAGKSVFVFMDHAGMTGYHLASVADFVVMDPGGSLLLPGYKLNRTFLRGSLEKLGLGFDEWRFLKYKSAAEMLVRDDMSEAEREQSQAFVDDWYEQTRADVSRSRHISDQTFDSVINQEMLLSADSALARGWVDTLAAWTDLEAVMKKKVGSHLRGMNRRELGTRSDWEDEWGTRPRVALVYALGVCDMEKGIRARWLESTLRKLGKDHKVKAIVLRVDSPGGDPLASDLVARAIKQCRRVKPVIVSQGQVAASGGYWISMCADTIVAGPTTVTGSIGVIGGWLHDLGASQKLGMTSDLVKRGQHADYDAGVRLPIVDASIPKRALSDDERTHVMSYMSELYESFVRAVSESRHLAKDDVEKLAQGHVYSGLDARDLKLVDELGGILRALDLATSKAGIRRDVQVVEYPSHSGWFQWPWKLPAVSTAVSLSQWEELIQLLIEFNGDPLALLPPGTYPEPDK